MASIGGEKGGVMIEGGNLISNWSQLPNRASSICQRSFLKRFGMLVVSLRNPSADYVWFVRQRVKHIVWEPPESGINGIHPPIINVIGTW